MPYDPSKRNGWAKGLIHFHTDFSDGGASVNRAAEIARGRGYDFLIVTDHLQNLPRKPRSFGDYVRACDEASGPDLLVIPGGEIEIDWSRGNDESEAHTLAMTIRELQGEFIWDPAVKPYDHWISDEYRSDPIHPIQAMLRRFGLPPAASHQFQHGYLSSSFHPEEHSDFRYYLERLATSRLLDFFYSGVIDAAHEPEDFALYVSRLNDLPNSLPAVYASCDYHYGPETISELLRDHKVGVLDGLKKLSTRLGPLSSFVHWLLNSNPDFVLGFLERRAPEMLKRLEEFGLQFAEEQLSHATYIYVDEAKLSEETVIHALAGGRTCVTRGRADFRNLQPPPSNKPTKVSEVRIRLDLPVTYSVHRPRSILIYRDGSLVEWRMIPDKQLEIDLNWVDPAPLPGVHNYAVYIPSKFLSSPILFDYKPAA